MNTATTSAPGSSLLPESTDLFTGAHLLMLAVLVVLVIVGIVFGMRLSGRRKQARQELADHNETVREKTAPPIVAPELAAPSPAVTTAVFQAPSRAEPAHPALVEADAQASAPSAAGGPVTQLKGLGPKVATRLGELGITTVGQIAALTDDEAATLDTQLGAFAGRMGRDRWQEQARFLAAGDRAGFESVFGRL